MLRLHNRIFTIAAVIFLLSTSFIFAGSSNKTGTNAAPELLIPVGARDIAMGGASIATTSGIDAIYWNPAGLARAQFSTSAMFSHMSYVADIPVNYFAVSTTFSGFGTLGFSLKSLGIGDILVTTEDHPDGTGEIISPTYVTLGVTYSRQLADNIGIGITTNLITERIDRVNATGIAFNAGVQYANLGNFNGLNIGVAVKNIGPQMQFDGTGLLRQGEVGEARQGYYKIQAGSFELPSTIEIGVSYTRSLSDDNAITLVSLFENNNFKVDEYKIGGEYSFRNMFFVRGGWNFAESTTDDNLTTTSGVDKTTYLFGGTAGVGVRQNVGDLDITLDYAYRGVKFLDGNHIISIKLGF
ncbi:MAG: PorV/PorQ family protein [Ignavibacteriae bacterium]|nr:PorV/PorQ family protein [Ignavibacteriota bacterium]